MSESENGISKKVSRRDALKLSTLALGGLAVGGRGAEAGSTALCGRSSNGDANCHPAEPCYPDYVDSSEYYTYYFDHLPHWNPLNPNNYHMHFPPDDNEMRITFLGSQVPPVRRAQQEMSIYVEVGKGGGTSGKGDSFVFDCGSGVCANYGAMGIPYGDMNKVFISHLHGDHMSDLTHIYCFGAAANRKSPLYVWGPSRSGVRNPKAPPEYYEDGVKDMCKAYRKAWRWHSESFSFLPTHDPNYDPPTKKSWGLPHDPVPVGGDSPRDGFALVPISLNWKKYGKVEGDNVAYYNPETGVKITHFPVIHCRQGSIGYKLEWNGLTMIYTSDTKPETMSIQQASGGKPVDVFIHECGLPPDVWAFKNMCLKEPPKPPDQGGDPKLWDAYQTAITEMETVQDSSHTPPGALGHLLSKIVPPPRLAVATHFPVADDTVNCAWNIIRKYCSWARWYQDNPQLCNLIWSFDLMVLKVFAGDPKPPIEQWRADVNDYGFGPVASAPSPLNPAKYHNNDATKSDDPCKQLDLETWIQPTDPQTGACNYRSDGY